jgi:hypothetical protein
MSTVLTAIEVNHPIMLVGSPGTGKTSIIEQACTKAGVKLLVSHPVVSEPTDYKGLPFPSKDGTEAHFLPYGDLLQLINAEEKLVFLLDDLGQAPSSVQAACMQMILARTIDGKKISDHVVFMACTNSREDKAGVSMILEPVKSRFVSIIKIEISTDDWVSWALHNDIPAELIGFIRFRPNLLEKFEPTRDMTNSPCPRTVENVAKIQNSGYDPVTWRELFSGAAGEGFANEYMAFLELFNDLQTIEEILKNPTNAIVPTQSNRLWAICGGLAANVNISNIAKILIYINRIPKAFQVMVLKDCLQKEPNIINESKVMDWVEENQSHIL